MKITTRVKRLQCKFFGHIPEGYQRQYTVSRYSKVTHLQRYFFKCERCNRVLYDDTKGGYLQNLNRDTLPDFLETLMNEQIFDLKLLRYFVNFCLVLAAVTLLAFSLHEFIIPMLYGVSEIIAPIPNPYYHG